MAAVHDILLVEDDDLLLRVMVRGLRGRGLRVLATTSASDALEHTATQEFAVVAVDYMMESANGMELLARIRDIQPEAVRVLLSGLDLRSEDVSDAVDVFMQKPCAMERFEELVETRRSAVAPSAVEPAALKPVCPS